MSPFVWLMAFAYLVFVVVVTAFAFALTSSPRIRWAVFIVVSVPLWIPFVTSGLGRLPCHLEAPGFVAMAPLAVDRLVLYEDAGDGPSRSWPFRSAFLAPCDAACGKALNRYFDGFPADVRVDEAPFSFEAGWTVLSGVKPAVYDARYARLWMAPAASPRCLALLERRPRWSGSDSTRPQRCIAGIEIPGITASYMVDTRPFTERTDKRGAGRTTTTAVGYLPFVSHHEQRLYRDGEMVARYRSFSWETGWLAAMEGRFHATCPVETYRTDARESRFWHILFENVVADGNRLEGAAGVGAGIRGEGATH